MLSLPLSVRIFVALEPLDMRKQFDRLANATRHVIREDPTTATGETKVDSAHQS